MSSALAGTASYDFTTDPQTDPNFTVGGNGVNTAPWQSSGGNPGGFLAVTYSQNGSYTGMIFPNIDPGKVVTAFKFECDLRVGNSVGDRAADGFSISFARDGDPVLADGGINGMGPFAGGIAEGGTTTGIAVSFDTWSGNTLPDGGDIEGIIVRVDNKTVNRTSLPTRHGACADITSLQTGPRDAAYWANGGDPTAPESWAGLCWQPFVIDLTADGKLTVSWKGNKILDAFQVDYFPTASRLVFAGRTGDANEHTHVDNIKLTTVAADVACAPNQVTGLKTDLVGSRRVTLSWAKGSLPCDANGQVAYEVYRNGTLVSGLLTGLTFTDAGVAPSTAYSYTVVAKNIAGQAAPASAALNVTTVADVDGLMFLKAEVYGNIGGTAVDGLYADQNYVDRKPSSVNFFNGLSYGESSNFGDTLGENYGVVISGVLTAPKSGQFRFFVRSDDASAFFLSANATIPTPEAESPIAAESGCCAAFQEVGDPRTSEPVALVAGQKYGFAFVVKEGGGGDWGQVAWREEGDTTPAGSLQPIRGAFLASKVDGVGAAVTITEQPANVTIGANQAFALRAAATGTSFYGNTVAYNWYKNGQPIIGATNPKLIIEAASAADNGAKYKVLAAVAGASVFSDEITLTVNADTKPATIVSANGTDAFNSVTVTWSEPVVAPSATTAANYVFSGGLTVSAAEQIAPNKVRLTTSAQTPGSTYNLTVNGVKDNAGNNSAATFAYKSFALLTGKVTYGAWLNETGGFATWIDNGVKDRPADVVVLRDSYYSNTGDQYENYFGQLKGFFIPATSGNYVFYIAADDHAELYLSTNEDPANKKRIAEEPSWGARGEWIGNGTDNNSGTRGEVGARTNISDEYANTEWASGATISLTAGNKYYLEVLYKEGGGGDHGGATFKLAGGANPANGVSALTGNLIATYADPTPPPAEPTSLPRIDVAPAHQNIAAGETATFSVQVASVLPLSYQWYRNNKVIAGATSATLTIANAGVQHIGDYRVRVENANGVVTTDDNNSRLTLKNAFVIEAEDFNFGNGQTVAAASTMPLQSGLYEGKDGQPGVDLSISESTADGAGNGNNYRQGWINNGTTVSAPAGANADVILDNGGGNTTRPDFVLANNYKLGWGDTGEWYQYTRDFPAGTYAAVLIQSRDGRELNAYTKTLEIVTGDPKTANAASTIVAEATHDGTGGWSSNDFIPFLKPGAPVASTAASDLATFTLGANSTVRIRMATGDGDLDGYLFYKVEGVTPAPTVSAVRNANGSVTVTFTGTLEVAEKPEGPYTAIPNASPYTITPENGARFARSRN